eukprot:TRINITY_DN28626_c0_g1_i1.p1 TRINITY_DN28626_c0_g1~~TRINITY_DN28626_c0_g1_i1.p1  ORF type:complete len:426 (+),score=91.58 TRINITY_DN28626_c0_g1_i1:78-1355(+)
MPRRVLNVALDLDNTLVHARQAAGDARETWLPSAAEAPVCLRGPGAAFAIPEVIRFPVAQAQVGEGGVLSLGVSHVGTEVRIRPGLPEFLRRLHDAGCRVSILSNGLACYVQAVATMLVGPPERRQLVTGDVIGRGRGVALAATTVGMLKRFDMLRGGDEGEWVALDDQPRSWHPGCTPRVLPMLPYCPIDAGYTDAEPPEETGGEPLRAAADRLVFIADFVQSPGATVQQALTLLRYGVSPRPPPAPPAPPRFRLVVQKDVNPEVLGRVGAMLAMAGADHCLGHQEGGEDSKPTHVLVDQAVEAGGLAGLDQVTEAWVRDTLLYLCPLPTGPYPTWDMHSREHGRRLVDLAHQHSALDWLVSKDDEEQAVDVAPAHSAAAKRPKPDAGRASPGKRRRRSPTAPAAGGAAADRTPAPVADTPAAV